ncbi:nicotinamide riboside transporter PnuC [Xanthomonas translucens]|uniref:Nicotinamide riboside transporter PnuC n=3 Tax=Xanthomonas campestris pv. translucens TaxID=343 RepID=A0A109HED9_XANCT|nr:nicotinamide riboside transporter PnuC [Xanthomonas translucens]KWV10662.1 aminotransferase [Xanthomonas translucens]MCC8445724.1 nicotinamide riboside transporter PnuC [Xanthomonas translucens pv. translucens]MCT8286367.1 nicotinamide riboside transporter PnuC [Xanthomonas translucens pv. translucens]MCT8304025.1 nicotinamide riboside transporter PnuC [Xanthomonas translucens pv. translucens]QSQ31387.1 nicotinamide mononucleotide transporter [Xanthomonas translucens pv. translucens]
MSPLELLAVLVNILGVWLTARRVRWCWPVNVVAVLLYAWLFYQWKLYSDMLLQGVYVVLQGYGWWRWSQGRLDHGKVQVGPLPRREGVLSLLAGAAGALSLGWLMHRHTDAALPWLDAALSAFSLVASVWAARKRIANWTLWIVLDSLYVGVFIYKGLYPTAALYAGFVLLAIYGLRLWQAQQRGAAVAAP